MSENNENTGKSKTIILAALIFSFSFLLVGAGGIAAFLFAHMTAGSADLNTLTEGELMVTDDANAFSVSIKGQPVWILSPEQMESCEEYISRKIGHELKDLTTTHIPRLSSVSEDLTELNKNYIEVASAIGRIDSYIRTHGSSTRLQTIKANKERRLAALRDEYEFFISGNWKRFRLKVLYNNQSVSSTEKEKYVKAFEDTIRNQGGEIEALEKELQDSLLAEAKRRESNRERVALESRIDRQKELLNRLNEELDKAVIECNMGLFASIVDWLNSNAELRIETNQDGVFQVPPKTPPYFIFSALSVEEQDIAIYWTKEISIKHTKPVLSNSSRRTDIYVPDPRERKAMSVRM